MAKALGHGCIALVLTALSFFGGLAWVLALFWRGKGRLFAFLAIYSALSLPHTIFLNTSLGWEQRPDNWRVLAVSETTPWIKSPWIYRTLNRTYVSPEMHEVVNDLAAHMHEKFKSDTRALEGTQTVVLDGSFPFFNGFPLLPHLSHDDGEKLDLALYWTDAEGRYLKGKSKSPIGYWGYVEGPSDCPKTWKDLRWDMPWLQTVLPDRHLDEARTRAALEWLAQDARVSKVLVEAHIAKRLGVTHPKIRFQGCRAARHDDHIVG